MEQALMVEGRVRVEVWVQVQAGVEWEGIALGRVPVGVVFALLVGQRFPIRWVSLAIT